MGPCVLGIKPSIGSNLGEILGARLALPRGNQISRNLNPIQSLPWVNREQLITLAKSQPNESRALESIEDQTKGTFCALYWSLMNTCFAADSTLYNIVS
ncbi:hypothetical protein VNO77_41655 [Canavalia gladiata]|uniref:Uncharacterized protein n=1 Tax=Canavalia gladiata TaxID=3824 RepID=A0AAN9K2Q7_CANGL